MSVFSDNAKGVGGNKHRLDNKYVYEMFDSYS